MTVGVFTPPFEPEDVSVLTTQSRSNLTGAINEVNGLVAVNKAAVALAEKVVHVPLGLVGPVAITALPTGAKIVGIQAHVTSAYPVSSVLNVGDHSGGAGALAATSIFNGLSTIVLTANGDTQAAVYATPVGDLSISVTGGSGATGASTIIIKYIDA